MIKPARILFISILTLVLLVFSASPFVRLRRVPTPARAEPDPPQETVAINGDNTLLVNGEPFFPIGIYGYETFSSWAILDEWKFNTMASNGLVYYSNGEIVGDPGVERVLNEDKNFGLKHILFLGTECQNWSSGERCNPQYVTDFINYYKNHPNGDVIISWYPVDEPYANSRELNYVLDTYSIVKQHDPNRPTFMVENGFRGGDISINIEAMETFLQATDIAANDPYPVPQAPLKTVADYMDASKTAVENEKPIWAIIQAFKQPWSERFPTPQEERNMVYLAIVHGAKGIIYYNLRGLFDDSSNTLWPGAEGLWNAIKDINAELTELSPVILSPDVPQVVAVTPSLQENRGIHLLFKEYKNQRYLFAVNSEDQRTNAIFTLPSSWSGNTVKVYKEDRTIQLLDNQFIDSFGGYDVHIYEISPPPGDADGNGKVDGTDLELLKQDYLGTAVHNTDFNSDGRVDCEDFAILQANYPE